MSDFDGRQLAIGVARGVRSFDVDDFGRLKGVQYADVWRPGENIARCAQTVAADGWEIDPEMSVGYGQMLYVNKKTGERTPTPPMRPAKPEAHSLTDCRHGFYAYFDGSNDYRSDARISAVVEGYGEVLIGSRGFRAGKARIVALCIPGSVAADVTVKPKRSRMWMLKFAARGAVGGCAGETGLAAVLNFMHAEAFLGVWLSVLAIGGFWASLRMPIDFPERKPRRKELKYHQLYDIYTGARSSVTPETVAKIRRNYPDLPVFGDFNEMVAAFPPDKGLEPSPETDPRFWEANA